MTALLLSICHVVIVPVVNDLDPALIRWVHLMLTWINRSLLCDANAFLKASVASGMLSLCCVSYTAL